MGDTVNYTCPSGDCTWEEVNSLAVCNHCTDVTASSSVKCTPSTQLDPISIYLMDYEMEYSCTYTTPNHLNTTYTTYDPDSMSAEISILGHAFYCVEGAKPDHLAYYALILNSHDSEMETLNVSQPTVMECSMALCSKQLYAQVRNGQYSEDVLAQVPLKEVEPIGHAPYGYARSRLQKLEKAVANVMFNKSHPKISYQVNVADKILVAQFLEQILTTNITIGLAGDGPELNALPSLVEKLAVISTNWIRQGPNHTSFPGEGYLIEPYLVAEWAWSVYPIVVLGAGLILFILTVALNSQREIELFKASSTALVFARVRVDEETCLESAKPRELEKTAKAVHVRLMPEHIRGLEFVAASSAIQEALPPSTPTAVKDIRKVPRHHLPTNSKSGRCGDIFAES